MTIMAALAQQESESISANVGLGIQFRNQQGKVRVNHNRFLGYTEDIQMARKNGNESCFDNRKKKCLMSTTI